MREFFSDIHCEDIVELLEVKLIKVWGPFVIGSPWSLEPSESSTLNFQQFINYSLDFLTLALVPLMSFCSSKLSFSVFIYLSKFEGQQFAL